MKILFALTLSAVLEFIKEIGWWVLGGLAVYFLTELICFAFGYISEFHFLRAVLLLGGLSLILLIAHKLPNWILKIERL
jgi:hypothetical protein